MDYKIKLGISGAILVAVILSSNPNFYLSILSGEHISNANSINDGIDSKADSLNMGYFPNLNHAQAIIGIDNGDFNRTFSNASSSNEFSFHPQLFSSGQSILEALYAEKIDAAYLDPDSIIKGYRLLGENEFRIVSGVSSGGVSFVVRNDSGIETNKDLGGKVFATPHLGGSQDVALKKYLIDNGFNTIENGGNVTVVNLKPVDLMSKFQNKEIDGAWVPEPIVTILKQQADGKIFVDESDLWPNGKFVSANIIVRIDYLRENPDIIKKLIETHVNETLWMNQMFSNSNSTVEIDTQDKEKVASVFNNGLKNMIGKTYPVNLLIDAMSRIEYTPNPLPNSLLKISEDAETLGYITKGLYWNDEFLKIYDLTILNKVLEAKGLKH